MNRITRIALATVIGFGLSRVMPTENQVQADAEAPELHPIVVSVAGAPSFKWSKPTTPYLDSLRTRFALDEVTAQARNDYERVRVLSRWVRTQWDDGAADNVDGRDPIALIARAADGERLRGDEYASALSGALNSLGVPARVLNLKTADSEMRVSGAGHTVTEAWLRDAKRWVMVDGQYDVLPTVHGKPASALELRTALRAKSAGVRFNSTSGTHPGEYGRWIAPYLHFMDSRLDQRMGVQPDTRVLMLIPQKSKPPRAFQRAPLRNTIYTTASAAFYPRPVLSKPTARIPLRPKPVAAAIPLRPKPVAAAIPLRPRVAPKAPALRSAPVDRVAAAAPDCIAG